MAAINPYIWTINTSKRETLTGGSWQNFVPSVFVFRTLTCAHTYIHHYGLWHVSIWMFQVHSMFAVQPIQLSVECMRLIPVGQLTKIVHVLRGPYDDTPPNMISMAGEYITACRFHSDPSSSGRYKNGMHNVKAPIHMFIRWTFPSVANKYLLQVFACVHFSTDIGRKL